MSSAIGGIGGYSPATMMQGMQGGGRRPDAAKMAEDLFAKLDTKGQGYIEQSDLESAMDGLASGSGGVSASEIFSTLDGDSDGKLTQSELSDSIKQLEQELRDQYDSMRMGMGGQGEKSGMPPPPPPPAGEGGNEAGFTKDELTAQLSAIGDSDSQSSSLIANLIANFDQADSNGDGQVSASEAMAFDQANQASATSDATDSTASASTDTEDLNAQVMAQIMRLMESYGLIGEDDASSTLSLTA